MFKKAVQRGRHEQRGEAWHSYPPTLSLPRQALFPWAYGEPLPDVRTKLADFFSIPLSARQSDSIDGS